MVLRRKSWIPAEKNACTNRPLAELNMRLFTIPTISMDTPPLGEKLEIVFEVAWRIFSFNETPAQLKEGYAPCENFCQLEGFFHQTQNARGPSRISLVCCPRIAARSNEVEGIEKKITTQ